MHYTSFGIPEHRCVSTIPLGKETKIHIEHKDQLILVIVGDKENRITSTISAGEKVIVEIINEETQVNQELKNAEIDLHICNHQKVIMETHKYFTVSIYK